MLWGEPLPENVAVPAVVRPLLERAVSADPRNSRLHEKLGYLHLDRFDFAAAAGAFQTALKLDPHAAQARLRLARCYNMMQRPKDALVLLETEEYTTYERGLALMKLGKPAESERELRAVLDADPDHPGACRLLCRLLRKSGRVAEMTAACEGLAERGATNAQLLYNWGWALALQGDIARASRLLVEPERISSVDPPALSGFTDIAELNGALADAILSDPHRLSEFPEEDEANRGSSRVDNLFTGPRPELFRSLLAALQKAIDAYPLACREGFDPWPDARPAAARLRPWGLLQRGGAYEAQHIHPGGWLSGVYYVRVPRSVSEGIEGRGCIEFGPPDGLAEAFAGAAPTQRYVPREGMLLLAPSHYPHRTIPSEVEEDRISIAFDVVPVRNPQSG